jgi:hypothetical protein
VCDDNWQAELPVGDTGRVLNTVATQFHPTEPASWRTSRIANKSIDFDFCLDSSQPSLGRSCAESRGHGVDRPAAGALMGIDVFDHVVLGDVRYWSFKEAGRL